jgi:uncharacterized delta-60 repeat protein
MKKLTNKLNVHLTSLALFITLFPCLSFAQPGSLDLSFGVGGIVVTDFPGMRVRSYEAALQADGKIVVAGDSGNSIYADFTLARYNVNGSLDTTFGIGGRVGTQEPFRNVAQSLAILNDGKIVVGGYSSNGSDIDFAVYKYLQDGSLDTTFGTLGKVLTNVNGADDFGYTLKVQPDGKILLAGSTMVNGNVDCGIVRYESDGTLDTTFGNGGIVISNTSPGNYPDFIRAIVLQTDGKIIASGRVWNGSTSVFGTTRYNTDGSLDNTFGTGGSVMTPLSANGAEDYDVALQSDGKIVCVGENNTGSTYKAVIVRYNANGTLDNTFGTGGIVNTLIGNMCYAQSVTVQPDNKIVVSGTSAGVVSSGYSDFLVVRYNSNGTLDLTFGSGGYVTTDFGGFASDFGCSVLLQPDAKILVAGYSEKGGTYHISLARYNPDVLTGIEESENNSLAIPCLSIFPNPSTGSFTINANGQVDIFNTLGEIIYSEKLTPEPIYLNQPPGVYFVKVMDAEKVYTKKLVIE